MIDLHTHSSCSDGQLDPEALVARATGHGVTTLALTDHDTTAGLNQAGAGARQRGMALIAGVEISVTWQRRTLHVVGLAFDPDNPTLTCALADLQARRHKRATGMAAKLEKIGVTEAMTRAAALADGGQIGRPHFARLLVADGYCRSMQQAFKRYLRPGRPAHVAIEWATLDQSIQWIQTAGGIAVLAHPHGYGMSGAWRRQMVAAFADAGGDGMEICTGTTNADKRSISAADAREHGLLGSIGSDFHGPEQRWLSLGGLQPLPDDLVPVWDDPRFQAMT